MISVLDYGCGNLGSIVNMLRRVGHQGKIIQTPEEILEATKIILPGVGAFDAGIRHLDERQLRPALEQRVVQEGIPLLGVCLGMQLLFERSEEGKLAGLGWVPGQVVRFVTGDTKLRIPHMGWSEVEPSEGATLFGPSEKPPRFYFVHSYHAADVPDDVVAARAVYGKSFVCAVERRNIFATQFHPEKSHRYGMDVLKRFAEVEPCPSPA